MSRLLYTYNTHVARRLNLLHFLAGKLTEGRLRMPLAAAPSWRPRRTHLEATPPTSCCRALERRSSLSI